LTGAKKNSADEFLIKKKDPLILPPDFEDLPAPEEGVASNEEISVFEETAEALSEESQSGTNSLEDSILKKIRRK